MIPSLLIRPDGRIWPGLTLGKKNPGAFFPGSGDINQKPDQKTLPTEDNSPPGEDVKNYIQKNTADTIRTSQQQKSGIQEGASRRFRRKQVRRIDSDSDRSLLLFQIC